MHRKREEAMPPELSPYTPAPIPCASLGLHCKHMEYGVYDGNLDSSSAPAGRELQGP